MHSDRESICQDIHSCSFTAINTFHCSMKNICRSWLSRFCMEVSISCTAWPLRLALKNKGPDMIQCISELLDSNNLSMRDTSHIKQESINKFYKEPDRLYIDFDIRSNKQELLGSWECMMIHKDTSLENMMCMLMMWSCISSIQMYKVDNTQNLNMFWMGIFGNSCFEVNCILECNLCKNKVGLGCILRMVTSNYYRAD
jgi:hypothetical protein